MNRDTIGCGSRHGKIERIAQLSPVFPGNRPRGCYNASLWMSWHPHLTQFYLENDNMFERLSHSFELAKSSWRVLKTDKKLLVFPFMSGLCCVLVLASFIVPLVIADNNGAFANVKQNNGQPPIWVYPVTFAFYFCNYFVIVFFNAALVSCALMRFNGQDTTIGDGLRAAGSRLPQIFAWALVSATVGMLLRLIENANEKAGAFISAILGTAWTVITFFVVPVLVVEKIGPFKAVSRSIAILKKTWGEALVGGFGLGLFKLLLALPGVALILLGAYLVTTLQPAFIGIGIIGAAVLYFLLWAAIGSALDTIFLTALYQYAAFEKVPEGFEREAMEGAFMRKKAA
jgi:Family of unknown function (DUF6159)